VEDSNLRRSEQGFPGDLFIEVVKPCFISNDPMFDSKRVFAQDTLWFCLDNVLLLLHPFMLFVMEELWQHLFTKGIQEG